MSYEKPDLSHLSDAQCRALVADLCKVVWHGDDGWHPDNECEIAEVIYLLNRYEVMCSGDCDIPYVVSSTTGERVYLHENGEVRDELHLALSDVELRGYGSPKFEEDVEERLGVNFAEMYYVPDHVDLLGSLVIRVSGKVKR